MKKAVFALAALSAFALPLAAGATTTTDLSGYNPSVGGGPNFGRRSASGYTLNITTTQKLVCGLTLSKSNLDFGTRDYNSYNGVDPTFAQTVNGTVACNNKNQVVKVTAQGSNPNYSGAFENLVGPTGEDQENVAMSWYFTPAAGANLYNTVDYTDLTTTTNAATNIYSADFQLAVDVNAHTASEAVYTGTYTGTIAVSIATDTL